MADQTVGDQLLQSCRMLAGQLPQGLLRGALAQQPNTYDDAVKHRVLRDVPAFSETANPAIEPMLSAQVCQYLSTLVDLLSDASKAHFAFAAEFGASLAEYRFPLASMLHSYRVMHKSSALSLRDLLLQSGSLTAEQAQLFNHILMEYSDQISLAASASYAEAESQQIDISAGQQSQLLHILLKGFDESDQRVAKLLRESGYLDQRRAYCLVLAQSTDPTEMLNFARAQRVQAALEEVLRQQSWHYLVEIHDNKVVALVSSNRRLSGWTTPQASLAKGVATALDVLGPFVLVGTSNDVPATAYIPNAYQEAALALAMATVNQRVLSFADIPLRLLLLHMAGDPFQRVLPTWSRAFQQADEKMDGALTATLRAYADANMNALKAAARLEVHPNTIYSRLQKIKDSTGLDAKSYHSLNALLMVADSRLLR